MLAKAEQVSRFLQEPISFTHFTVALIHVTRQPFTHVRPHACGSSPVMPIAPARILRYTDGTTKLSLMNGTLPLCRAPAYGLSTEWVPYISSLGTRFTSRVDEYPYSRGHNRPWSASVNQQQERPADALARRGLSLFRHGR
jgi:hypothetical protein